MLIYRILYPVIVAALLAVIVEAKPTGTTRAKHLVPSIPGFVPVYIRPGNTPLQDINKDLAEAFDFNAVKHGRLAFGRRINDILSEKEKNKKLFDSSDLKNINDLILNKEDIGKNEVDLGDDSEDTYIQKIPRY